MLIGPGFVKGQQSVRQLGFIIPEKWESDAAAAKQYGLAAVLVPSGQTMSSAKIVITVAFQRKDPNNVGLDSLESFFRADVGNVLKQFPDARAERWQPSRLDPSALRFMSLEMYGRSKDRPSPHRFVLVDSGDGFFSLTLTAETRNELRREEYDRFFNSLRLK